MTYWVVVVRTKGGEVVEVGPEPDNRKTARHIASVNKSLGHSAYVIPRHELEAARKQFGSTMFRGAA